MIFAAGLGTRLKPLTDTKPKALIPVGGETLLGRTISRLMTFGYQYFVVNVHHFGGLFVSATRRRCCSKRVGD